MGPLHTEGDISRHAEGDCFGQRCGLCEEVQVVQSKDQLDGFIHLNSNLKKGERLAQRQQLINHWFRKPTTTHSLLLFVNVAGLGQLDVSCTQLSCGRELDSILGAGDHDGVTDLRQVTADASELCRRHLYHTAVLLLLSGQTGTK